MELACEHCSAKLNIPDDKIPKGRAIQLTCPKCKGKMTLGGKQAGSKRPSGIAAAVKATVQPERLSEGNPEQGSKERAYSYVDYSSDETLVFYEEGTKLALIMVDYPGHAEKIQKSLKQLGYECISTPNTRDAIGKLRFHHFDLVVLSDGFGGQPIENNQITHFMNRLPMSVRRRIFLVFLSSKFKTMDNMMAFARSANVVINSRDLDKLHLVLKKAISENEKFYKVFTDTLSEVGKA
ncbi:MAG: zinc-ribbon domain-containing protein [Deltaproteobacteria bacterium]